jgi:DHA2 family multidrug resistance protein-like MFS transporter
VGSAVNDTTRELGGALGVAVLGSLLASQYAGGVPDLAAGTPVPGLAGNSLGAALGLAGSLPAGAGQALASAARVAFVDAMSTTLVVSAAVASAAAVMVRRYYPDRIVVPRFGPAPAPVEPGSPEASSGAGRLVEAASPQPSSGAGRLVEPGPPLGRR